MSTRMRTVDFSTSESHTYAGTLRRQASLGPPSISHSKQHRTLALLTSVVTSHCPATPLVLPAPYRTDPTVTHSVNAFLCNLSC